MIMLNRLTLELIGSKKDSPLGRNYCSCVSLQNSTVKNYRHGMFPRSFGNEETLSFQRL